MRLQSLPLTASRYSPSLTLTPGCVSGARSSRVPVLAAVDLGEPVAAVLDLVVGAEQAALGAA